MADDADIANEYMTRVLSSALNKRLQNAPRPKVGAKVCKECGEDIPLARRQLGFELCVECAEETERRKSLFGDY
jgi:phage/conjugal plasmid C-4 type zinc finger TraR family protein